MSEGKTSTNMETEAEKAPVKDAQEELVNIANSRDQDKEEEEDDEEAKSSLKKSPKSAPAVISSKRNLAEQADDERDEKEEGTYWKTEEGAKRQRKSLEHFRVETSAKDSEDKLGKILGAGSGTYIRDIPSVVDAIKDHTISKSDKDDPLKVISRMIFGKQFHATELKKHLCNFNGMVFDDEKQEANWCARFQKKTIQELKDMLGCLHLERSGPQKALASRLMEFLKKPSKSMADKGMAVAGKKTAPKKKATTTKSQKDDKRKKKSVSKKESDSSDADEPLVRPKKDNTLEESVIAIVSKQDLSTLTLRIVREKLEVDFGIDPVSNKEKIKKIVNEYVKKHGNE